MKNEIKLLRKAQKVLWDNQYPGYPFQMTIVIDLAEKSAWLDYGNKISLETALARIGNRLLYAGMGAKNTDKQTFIVDQHLEDYKEYLTYEEEDFHIDNLNAIRLYFALSSAIFNRNSYDNVYIFGVVDDECDYIDVQVFKNEQEIKDYVSGYFEGE